MTLMVSITTMSTQLRQSGASAMILVVGSATVVKVIEFISRVMLSIAASTPPHPRVPHRTMVYRTILTMESTTESMREAFGVILKSRGFVLKNTMVIIIAIVTTTLEFTSFIVL